MKIGRTSVLPGHSVTISRLSPGSREPVDRGMATSAQTRCWLAVFEVKINSVKIIEYGIEIKMLVLAHLSLITAQVVICNSSDMLREVPWTRTLDS